jgi:hypothetical protein
LVWPLFRSDIIELLQKLYEWSIVDPADIDEEKYLLSKKFAEVQFNNNPLSLVCFGLQHTDGFQSWYFAGGATFPLTPGE